MGKHKLHTKDVANELIGTLSMSGMKAIDLGMTYLTDRLPSSGDIIESALDHIYIIEELTKETSMRKSQESSSDHVPIIAEVKHEDKPKGKHKIIYKRSMKDFTVQKWKDCLIQKRWERLGETEDVEEMSKDLTYLITEALGNAPQ